jgi:8-oxo-dGTP pyrophosphatase MutT (NUDIX family)
MTPPAEAAVRDAASLILLREAPTPGEATVLMGQRGATARFMPSRLVFPGGAVDPEDFGAAAATELSAGTRAGLERGAAPDLARALAIAAARELEEETALSMGRPPALDQLTYLCRAVTPPSRPIRFNARFLIIPYAHVTGTLGGSGELEGLRDYRLAELESLELAWITGQVVRQLHAYLAMSPAARDARTRFPICIEQDWGEE